MHTSAYSLAMRCHCHCVPQALCLTLLTCLSRSTRASANRGRLSQRFGRRAAQLLNTIAHRDGKDMQGASLWP